ncbi:MAG: hypothetical protein AAB886_02320 [Patescibacteria group bacterium]
MTPVLIGVAGPSGAGKSTFCRRVLDTVPGMSRLKLDDYFVDDTEVDHHPMGYAYWDHPASIKWDGLVEAAQSLKQGRSAVVPNYERAINKMVGTKIVEPSDYILVDGYQVLYHPDLRDLLDLKLYFDLEEDIQVDRRIMRQPDVDRGYLYHVMIPAARAFLYPTKRYADFVIDANGTPEEVFENGVRALWQLGIPPLKRGG